MSAPTIDGDDGGSMMTGRTNRVTWMAGAALALSAGPALGHAADRGHVMLLPTGYYLVGGALAVALTFAVLALAPAAALARATRPSLPLGNLPVALRPWGSAAALAILVLLLASGFLGSRDPLSNPLPLTVWTMFWIGLTLLQGAFGNLWWWIDPWYAPWRMARAVLGPRAEDGFLRLPARLGYAPAIALFYGFAWFELVDPAPDDPARLATVLSIYYLVNLAACVVFGHAEWSRRGEPLTVFLGMIARLAVIEAGPPKAGWRRLALRLPGAKLVEAPPLPPSGVLFLLLALASVSFDGLMRTFFWLGLHGINPLEFPGRTAMMAIGTWGILATFLLLAGAFLLAVAIGERLAPSPAGWMAAAGALVWSIVPISIAYHFAHYLTALAIDGQYALAAYSDPLMRGWDLFGTAGMHVQAGVTLGAGPAWTIWNLQAAAIIGGHLLAVAVAHAIAHRLHGSTAGAAWGQFPLASLMVVYTVFGLWLLSAPTAT